MGLTSLFGMVRGEPHRYNHLKTFGVCKLYKSTYRINNNILKKGQDLSYTHEKLYFIELRKKTGVQ